MKLKANWKVLCVCACIAIGVSVILPYFSVSGLGITISRNLMDTKEGIYVLLIAAAALVFSLLCKFEPAVLLGISSLGLFFVENNSLKTNLSSHLDALIRSVVHRDPGYYFLLIGSLALIAFAFLGSTEHERY